MRSAVLYSLLAIGLLVVFLFSWLPQPRLELSHYLPLWVTRWADDDANMNIRTAIPFVFLGGLSAIWLASTNRPWPMWPAAWLGLVGVVTLAEAGQLLLPLRHFDWGDIGWGAAGAAAGLVLTTALILAGREIKSLF
ncbi:hypothetical protein [Spirosoma linguale]|uniref:VanZ-like domain-containing protein n=1 Tax=Spirosoma linguale (strain ATCC 33905 / DSM 74 / LMG 10896 / Claus 1) TaxID=504472 RepID=D2QTX1_SPILD|nr:hypothetical protein Slin_6294 [Spirosoma linguale DSM 74]